MNGSNHHGTDKYLRQRRELGAFELKQTLSIRIRIQPSARGNATPIRTAEVTISIALDSYRRPGDPIVKNNVYGVIAGGIECFGVDHHDMRMEPIHENTDAKNVGFEVRSTGVLQILQAGPSTVKIVST